MIRRPAAAPRRAGVLRRPAVAVDGDRGDGPALKEELNVGDLILGEESSYYGTQRKGHGSLERPVRNLFPREALRRECREPSHMGERDYRLRPGARLLPPSAGKKQWEQAYCTA